MWRRAIAWFVAVIVSFGLAGEMHGASRVVLVPHLRAGQVLHYKCLARMKRREHTGSYVAIGQGPEESQTQISINIVATVKEYRLDKGKPVVTMHAELESPQDPDNGKTVKGKLDFTIGRDGQVANLSGFEDLAAEQRVAWQFWLSQFAYGWTLPGKGVSPGEKWKTTEAEKTPTPIEDLVWERETTYVQNDKCPVTPVETCAVLLTNAALKQKSFPGDTTPEAYKLHQLKTSGIAKGANETITYVSLKTHLMMRGKEDVQQMMDAIVAKADGSNEVRYLIEANSQFETLWMNVSGASTK